MEHHRIKRLPAALLAAGVLLVTAAAALAATPTAITLNIHGGVNQRAAACRQPQHYMAFKLKKRISMEGYVTPAPAFPDQAWRVKIKIKKCVLGVFKTIGQPHVRGNGVLVNGVKEGHFRWAYTPKAVGFYFARAYYYTTPTTSIISSDEHFHVTK